MHPHVTLEKFAAAWEARDIVAGVECFAPDAVYHASIGPLPGEIAKGHRQIEVLIDRMFAHDAGAQIQTENINVHDNSGSWTWRYDLPDGSAQLGCDLFTFRNGLIAKKDAYRKLTREIDQ